MSVCRVSQPKVFYRTKVFKGLSQRGQWSLGWFYGFKLHLICNEKGELLSFMLTPGNVDDRDPLMNNAFIEAISGKIVSSQYTMILLFYD